jgi:hypothetical protein
MMETSMSDKLSPSEICADFKHCLNLRYEDDLGYTLETLSYTPSLDDDIVYVAWIPSMRQALKVGITKESIDERWKGILGVMQPKENRRIRNHELETGKRLVELVKNKTVEIWAKPAEIVGIGYDPNKSIQYSLRGTEEEFLDHYYCPLYGTPLRSRRKK